MFENFLTPHLGVDGFAGHYKRKCGSAPEGCAAFWRTDRFELVQDLSFNMKDALASPDNEFAVGTEGGGGAGPTAPLDSSTTAWLSLRVPDGVGGAPLVVSA